MTGRVGGVGVSHDVFISSGYSLNSILRSYSILQVTQGESIAFSLYGLDQSRVQVFPGDGGKTSVHHTEHTPSFGLPDRRLTPQRQVDGLIR